MPDEELMRFSRGDLPAAPARLLQVRAATGEMAEAPAQAGLAHRPARGFRGRTLTRADQARRLRHWASEPCHPHEALAGLLALLHGAAVSELRPLTIKNVNTATRTVRLGRRSHPVPLDPLSFAALQRCLDHRAKLGTENPHVIVTRGTRAHRTPASLVWTLLLIGPAHVFPRYLWWGPLNTPLTIALIVIVAGAVWVLRSVRMMTMALAFLLPFAVLVGISVAAAGQSFLAIWHAGTVGGFSYWKDISLSPELFIFAFFMMSDPRPRRGPPEAKSRTAPAPPRSRRLLLEFQTTEFGVKLGILASLTMATALVPLVRATRPPAERKRLRHLGSWVVGA